MVSRIYSDRDLLRTPARCPKSATRPLRRPDLTQTHEGGAASARHRRGRARPEEHARFKPNSASGSTALTGGCIASCARAPAPFPLDAAGTWATRSDACSPLHSPPPGSGRSTVSLRELIIEGVLPTRIGRRRLCRRQSGRGDSSTLGQRQAFFTSTFWPRANSTATSHGGGRDAPDQLPSCARHDLPFSSQGGARRVAT
jgi:hypothetical protein